MHNGTIPVLSTKVFRPVESRITDVINKNLASGNSENFVIGGLKEIMRNVMPFNFINSGNG